MRSHIVVRRRFLAIDLAQRLSYVRRYWLQIYRECHADALYRLLEILGKQMAFRNNMGLTRRFFGRTERILQQLRDGLQKPNGQEC